MQILIFTIKNCRDLFLSLIGIRFAKLVSSLYTSSIGRLIQWLVAPILKPFRRLNLQFMGLDWTVMAAMIALNMGTRFLVQLLLLLA